MSSDLVIEWDGGDRVEVVPLGSHRLMRDYWRPLAIELGLELVPLFYSCCPVEPDNLNRLLDELTTFRAATIRRGPCGETDIETVDRLTDALLRLKRSENWSASIG